MSFDIYMVIMPDGTILHWSADSTENGAITDFIERTKLGTWKHCEQEGYTCRKFTCTPEVET